MVKFTILYCEINERDVDEVKYNYGKTYNDVYIHYLTKYRS